MNSPHSRPSSAAGLGAKIRARRRVINRTLAQTATEAGISTSFLSQVERELTMPSVRSLKRIAVALNMPVQYFVDSVESSTCRSHQRKYFGIPGFSCLFAHLTAALPQGQLQSILVRVPAGTPPLMLPTFAAEESLFVTAGELTLELEHDTYVLRPGDTAYYRSNQPRHWANQGSEEAVVVWTGTPRLL